VRLLHCSNLPKHFFKDVIMDFQAIIAGTVARKIPSALRWPGKAGAMTYCRFSTDDFHGRSGDMSDRGNSPTIHWKPLGARAWPGFHDCRSCFASSVSRASNIMSRPTSLRWPARCTKQPSAISAGACTTTISSRAEAMAIVAGVDFGTLSVRVTLFDSGRADQQKGGLATRPPPIR